MSDNLEDRKRKATAEWKELIKWAISEEDKVSRKWHEEGAIIALDTNREAYAYIREIEKKRLKEIAEKYDLPYKINI